MNRLEIKSGELSDEFHAVHKPYDRKGVSAFYLKLTLSDTELTLMLDLDLLDYVYRDNMEWRNEEDLILSEVYLKLSIVIRHIYMLMFQISKLC
ncbi:MAG: hypothetical protein R2728_11220 [Chitinophagales bacterium]